MNFSANKPYLVRLRKVWYYCFFGFTPALLSKLGEKPLCAAERRLATLETLEASHPYLDVVGAPPLRFRAPVAIATPEAEQRRSRSEKPPIVPVEPPPAKMDSAQAAVVQQSLPDSAKPQVPAPAQTQPQQAPAIIPDEARPRIHPEEFLPFFQLPDSARPHTSEQAPIPPSSATYRLE